ncbi:MAG: hypothetical protein WCF67_18880 [Chitinophagaceae bacterium]
MDKNQSAAVHEVQPGFNAAGAQKESARSLSAPASLDIFDGQTRKLLESGKSFKLKLGDGFETPVTSLSHVAAPCKGLASIEQLSFLKEKGMTGIIMNRLHPTLAENAKSLGIDIEIENK